MDVIQAILFDKDGTLFDFEATWRPWVAETIRHLAAGDATLAAHLADALQFDLDDELFWPDSISIAGTVEEQAEAMAPHLAGRSVTGLVREMEARAVKAPQVEFMPLRPVLSDLRQRGFRLGIVTNDAEAAARAHVAAAGVADLFDVIVGFDSGHGGKPGAGPVLGAVRTLGIAPRHGIMVGDSLHDLHAAQAAGMAGVGVLTGPARRDTLAPHAVAVLESIADLAAWLESKERSASL